MLSNKSKPVKKRTFKTTEQIKNTEESHLTIITEKPSDGLFSNILKYLIPSSLFQAYQTMNIIILLKNIDTKSITEKILSTKLTSVFVSDDYFRDKIEEFDLDQLEKTRSRKMEKDESRRTSISSLPIKRNVRGVSKSCVDDSKNSKEYENDKEIICDNESIGFMNKADEKNISSIVLQPQQKSSIDCLYSIDISKIFSKKVLSLIVIKGINSMIRPSFWFMVSGAKYEYIKNPGYFNFLIEKYPIPLCYEKQIELDLKRTFPEDSFFQNKQNLQKLKNILLAYARRNVSIGYVQGFNFIVGRLMKFFPNQEEAFYMFCTIIESKIPCNYYSEMCGLMADVDITIKLIYIFLPDLYTHLINKDILEYIKNILLQWYLSIFTHNFPEDMGTFVMDLFFIQGSIILIKIGFLILKENQSRIIQCDSIFEVKNILNKSNSNDLLGDIADIKLKMLEDFILNDEILDLNRSNLSKFIEERINEYNQSKIELKKKDFHSILVKNPDFYCDPEWPICLYDIDSSYSVCDFFIFKLEVFDFHSILIENYFYSYDSQDNTYDNELEYVRTMSSISGTGTNENNENEEKDQVANPIEEDIQIIKKMSFRTFTEHTKEEIISNEKANPINMNKKVMFSFRSKKNKENGNGSGKRNENGGKYTYNEEESEETPRKERKNNEEYSKIVPFNWNKGHISSQQNGNMVNILNKSVMTYNSQLSFNAISSRSKLTFNDRLKIDKPDEIRFENILIERKIHTEECIKNSKSLKLSHIQSSLNEKSFNFKGYDSVDFNLTTNTNKNQLQVHKDSDDYMNILKKVKGRGMKSVSMIYDSFENGIINDGNDDFNSFISNLKNKYNKIVETKGMLINLIEENRKKMDSSVGK